MSDTASAVPQERAFVFGSANIAVELVPPDWASSIRVFFDSNGGALPYGKLAWSGTDGVAIGSSALPVPTAQWFDVPCRKRISATAGWASTSVFVASPSGATTFYWTPVP